MDIKELTDLYLFNTYKRNPIVIKKAKGSWVWDEKGKKYLDFFSGLAVSGIGHAMPAVVSAIQSQSKKLLHVSNLFYTEPAALLARELCRRSFAKKVYLCNSGAEANEAAIKLARKYGRRNGEDHYEIIVFENSFHGRTLGALAATAQPKFHEGFGPLPPGFPVAKFNQIDSVERLITPRTAAILIELIQGEGGVRPASRQFLNDLRKLADQRALLLIFDGVQCSLGRTGDLFSYETYGVVPDVLTLAKGLGGGMPIAAMLGSEKVADVLGPGDHGTTFGGNPVCSMAALAVLKLLSPKILKNVKKQSQAILKDLEPLTRYPFVREFRAVGLMMGMELTVPGEPFVDACRKRGLLINCTQGNVLRFLPPLALSDSERRFAVRVLQAIFSMSERVSR
jgi:predicted acetylornithine/succinylornithine family transaminase